MLVRIFGHGERRRTEGFTLVELLTVMAIIGIIATISAASFRSMYRAATLKAASSEVYSALTHARTNTLASQDSLVYGVHVSSTSVTRFEGAAYAPGSASNEEYIFEGGVTATSSLITDGTDIVFARLTGESSAAGTLYLSNSDGTATTSIIIHLSGLIEYE